MNLSKPLNELTYEELCRHMAENQELIEWNYEHRFEILIGRFNEGPNPLTGDLILFCDKCKSPYNINVVEKEFPFCETCHRYSQITVVESILPDRIDKHINFLCRQLVRAASHCCPDAAEVWLDQIYDYVYGSNAWNEQNLYYDNPINWYPIDFSRDYEDYVWSVSEGEPEEKPDRNRMMQSLSDNIVGMFQYRDEILQQVDSNDVLEYHDHGMVIHRPISTFGIKHF